MLKFWGETEVFTYLLLILGFNVTFGILKKMVVICFFFHLGAVASFWPMSFVGQGLLCVTEASCYSRPDENGHFSMPYLFFLFFFFANPFSNIWTNH